MSSSLEHHAPSPLVAHAANTPTRSAHTPTRPLRMANNHNSNFHLSSNFSTPTKASTSGGRNAVTSPRFRYSSRATCKSPSVLFSNTVARDGDGTRATTHLPRRVPRTPCTTTTPASSSKKRASIVGSANGTKRRLKFATGSPQTTLSSADRFIPNRSLMRVDLCRASVVSAEKRRVDSMRKGENVDPNSRDVLTPLQSEFRRRMRGALLSIPVESGVQRSASSPAFTRSDTAGSASESPTQEGERNHASSSSLLNTSRSSLSFQIDPAYQAPPDPDADDARDNLGPGGLGRMLNFVDDSPAFLVGPPAINRGLPFPTPNRLPKIGRARTLPASMMHSDPFSHDQLRVLQRSASGDFASPGPFDPLSSIDSGLSSVARKVGRRIPSAPSRILDAPELVDDYYLNLLSWGADNILAVALGQSVYLWYADTEEIDHLLTLSGPDDFVTSVSWCTQQGNTHHIAIGTNESPVQIWDATTLQMVRRIGGHSARVGSLSWNQHWLSSGSRDSLIIQHDLRSPHRASTYVGHTQEVCGLAWSDDGSTLASGGNENYLCLWDAAMSRRASNNEANRNASDTISPRVILTNHQAAVKALAWCPFHRGLLASGGGTADRTIKFWNSNSGAMLNSIDTGSQVCSLLWSKHNKEICSSHGFSENQLILWKYPTMTKIQELTGHHARVLHMDQNPDGSCVVSAAADETLRFWDVFGSAPSSRKRHQNIMKAGSFSGGMAVIR